MAKKRESLLWSFRREEQSRTHFILGTMHVRSEQAYTAVTMAKHYMEQCAIYAGEMDLNDPNLDNIGDYFLLPEGQSLHDFLSEKKFIKYKKIINKAYGIDLDIIAHYKPMVIANMIAESLITRDYDMALDHFLWENGHALGMNMKGLESAQDQFDIMQKISFENQMKSLKSSVKNVKNFRKKILKMSELYEDGQLTPLYKAAKKSMGELRKLMIYDRNSNMTERLIDYTREGATFTSVGAAHLAGAKGMLRLLKNSGFVLKPIEI